MPHLLVVPDPDVERVLVRLGYDIVMGRGRLGVSQAWLAAAAGTSQPTISRLEAGRATGLRLERYARVVAVLETGRPVAGWDPAIVLERQGLERRLRRERRLREILADRGVPIRRRSPRVAELLDDGLTDEDEDVDEEPREDDADDELADDELADDERADDELADDHAAV